MLKRMSEWWENWKFGRSIKWLVKARFDKIWPEEDLDDFNTFVRTQGIPARGFVLSFKIKQGGYIWFFYPIDYVLDRGNCRTVSFRAIKMSIPKNPDDRTCPDEWRTYPILRAPQP